MDEKEELIDRLQEALGHIPTRTRYLLDALTRPDVIEYTKRFVRAADLEGMCRNFKPPWNCAKEAEARYENIKYGWLGGVNGATYSDWWCEPCRRRVMEE